MKDLHEAVAAEVEKVVIGQAEAVDVLLAAARRRPRAARGCPASARRCWPTSPEPWARLPPHPVHTGHAAVGPHGHHDPPRRGSLPEGPVFTNLLLADEINRTPPKTQAALLEAMQERQVTIDGVPPAARSVLVVATQNPIEYEGTYPLPEAQLDRFLVKVDVGYPDEAGEVALLGLGLGARSPPQRGLGSRSSGRRRAGCGAEVDASRDRGGRRYVVARHPPDPRPADRVRREPARPARTSWGRPRRARARGRDFVTPDESPGRPVRAASTGWSCGRRPSWSASRPMLRWPTPIAATAVPVL